MTFPLRDRRLPKLVLPLLAIAFLGLRNGSCEKIPLFARFAADEASLRSYAVPVHTAVALHKLITFHFGLNGTVYFKQPDRIALNMHMVPAEYRQLFADLGTPRIWPQIYDLQVVGSETTGTRTTYHLKGVPKQSSDVTSMLADVSDDGSPIVAQWVLR